MGILQSNIPQLSMNIELESGNIDTNKLSDREAEIYEALNNFYEVCRKYNVTSLTRIILDDKKFVGSTTVNSNTEQRNRDFNYMLDLIHDFVSRASGGSVGLVHKDE